MHAVTVVEFQESVEDCPVVMDAGVAAKSRVGIPGSTVAMVTVAECVTLPPRPVHVSVYVVLAVGETNSVPDVA